MEMAWRPTIVRTRAAVLLQRADVCRVGKKILIKGHANIIGDETGSAQCSVTKTALPRAQTSPYGAHRVTKRSEGHTSELQSLMRISYAVFCLKKKKKITHK